MRVAKIPQATGDHPPTPATPPSYHQSFVAFIPATPLFLGLLAASSAGL